MEENRSVDGERSTSGSACNAVHYNRHSLSLSVAGTLSVVSFHAFTSFELKSFAID